MADVAQELSIQPTDFVTELRILSQVCTYFDIASKRIIEVIPMVFEISFAKGFGERLRRDFKSKLNILDEGGLKVCEKFAKEDPAIQKRKLELLEWKQIVEHCLKVLDGVHSVE
jgi:hypothetical protein